jgi:putative endonuclease
MALWQKLTALVGKNRPEHLRTGELGEKAARKYLRGQGLKFLTANFVSAHGEIDLVFRDGECLVFVEVKTRAADSLNRPSRAVDKRKQRLISKSALEYLRLIKTPQVPFRFDIVEVLMESDQVREVRHLKATFTLSPPYRYGAVGK